MKDVADQTTRISAIEGIYLNVDRFIYLSSFTYHQPGVIRHHIMESEQ